MKVGCESYSVVRPGLSLVMAFVVVCLAVVLVGCKSQRVSSSTLPKKGTTLLVAKSESGVTLQWHSELGKLYTILSSEHLDHRARWQPVEGLINIRGTGEDISRTMDTRNNLGSFYRLHVTPTAQAH